MSNTVVKPSACVGCGILAANHPVVAVMQPADVPDGVQVSVAGPRGFVAAPCCDACFTDPAHRVRPIKGHFFPAADAAVGVYHAGSNSIGGK